MRGSKIRDLQNAIKELETILSQPPRFSNNNLPRLQSWDSFVKEFQLESWKYQQQEVRTSLMTQLLTYPLTISSFVNDLSKRKKNNKEESSIFTIDVIGARAEATLPTLYWAQLLQFLDASQLTLNFVGPDVPAQLEQKRTNEQVGTKTLWKYYTKSSYSRKNQVSEPDLVVLFNPGLSHKNLVKNWKPTLEEIFQLPLLVTGLHEQDCNDDFDLFMKLYGSKNQNYLLPKLNPFSSHVEHQDENGRKAYANQFIWGCNI